MRQLYCFIIWEGGSFDACKTEDWEKDWFCCEIAFALEKKKNNIDVGMIVYPQKRINSKIRILINKILYEHETD